MRVEDFGAVKITLDRMWWPLMELSDCTPDACAVCGRTFPVERHHVVPRSAGKVIDVRGREMHKPLIRLCGFGNNLQDADGRYLCHGKAEQHMMHFRNNNGWYSVLDLTDPLVLQLNGMERPEPVGYLTALGMQGWRAL